MCSSCNLYIKIIYSIITIRIHLINISKYNAFGRIRGIYVHIRGQHVRCMTRHILERIHTFRVGPIDGEFDC
jgi:hypothetical protein